MRYDPIRQLPTKADLSAGEELIKTITKFDGDVFIPNHPYLGALAGKKPHALSICMRDVWRGDRGATPFILLNELKSAINQHQFAAIILDAPQFSLLPLPELGLEQFYQRQSFFLPNKNVFVPITGWPARPLQVYVVKD